MKKLLLLTIVALTINVTNAQWQTNGPAGRIIYSLATSNSSIYAGTDSGLYLSSDNGGTWLAVGLTYPLGPILSLAISGSNIFAGIGPDLNGNALGVYLSANNGGIWTLVYNTGNVYSLAISGSNIFAGTYDGLFLSPNDGGNWTAVNSGLPNTNIFSLAISGSNIFAGTDEGVYLSSNNGGTWMPVDSGLQYDSSHYDYTTVYSLVISGSNIFVGTYDGVFLSTNNGSNWMAVNTGLPANIRVFSLAISGTNIFAGTDEGVYLSTNNGSNWSAVNTGLPPNITVLSLAINNSNIFAGTDSNGVWQQPLAGILTCSALFTLYPDTSTPHTYYALNQATGTWPLTYSWSWGDGDTSTGVMPSHTYTDSGYYNICLTITDSTGCTSSYCDSSTYLRSTQSLMIYVSVVTQLPTGTGIQQMEKGSFSVSIYPNPTNNNFIIETTSTGQKNLQMYDLTGQLLLSQTISNNKTTINASGLAPGIYAVSLQGTEGVVTKKLVVER